MHAQGQVGAFVAGHGHFAGFRLDFVAQRGNGFDHAAAGAIRAGLAEHALERLLGALASDAHQAKFVEAQRFGRRFIFFEGLLQREQNFVTVAALFHVDEVDDDDAAQVAQANLADDLLHGFEVGLDDGVFEASGALANEFAGVDIDGHERFGVIDDDVAAGLQPNFSAQGFVELVLDSELLENRRFLGVELDLVDELGLEAADELDDLAVLLFIVNPNTGEIVADVIPEDALDEVEVAVEQSGRLALLVALLYFVPGLAEELDVGANLVVGGAACGGADDKAPGISAAGFTDETAKPRAIFGGDDFARYPGVMDRRHVDQKAARQGHVAGDPRALLAERRLGDLDDDVLAGLQHFGNELRTSRRSGTASLITTVLPGAAGTAFETRSAAAGASAAIRTAATAVGTATTAIRPSATAVASTVTSTAAERPLEARARIAADAG